MKDLKKAAVCNGILLAGEVFANSWLISEIRPENRLRMLRFFTIDSNILMGIVAAAALVYQVQMLQGKRKVMPRSFYLWKLAATASVSLTMLVTVFFLAPTSSDGYLSLFRRCDFFLHLINPLLAMFVFVFFEKEKERSLRSAFVGIVPMLLYAAIYLSNALSKAENGMVPSSADWYGFFILGVKSIWFVLPIIIVATSLISVGLWRLNRVH